MDVAHQVTALAGDRHLGGADVAQVQVRYLDDAIAAALAGGDVPVAETPPVGCLIRFPRRRE